MKRNLSYITVGLLTASLALLGSCGPRKSKDGRTDTYSSGVISFASDESFSPIIEEEREVFEFTYKNAKVKPIYTNETEAVNMLMKGKICLVITSRDYSKKERKNLEDRTFMPRAIKIAYDGLALIVNKANTDTCITVKDFKKILAGKVTKWSDIYPNNKKGDIEVVFDTQSSSAINWCVDSFNGGKAIANPNVYAAKNSVEVINYVEKTPNAIGIIGSNWLNDKRDTTNTTFNKNITVMKVSKKDKAEPSNSWRPYQYYILNGNYPLIRTIYALLNDPINGLPWGFANFIASPKGQMIIFKSGLLPVQGNIVIRDVNVSEE